MSVLRAERSELHAARLALLCMLGGTSGSIPTPRVRQRDFTHLPHALLQRRAHMLRHRRVVHAEQNCDRALDGRQSLQSGAPRQVGGVAKARGEKKSARQRSTGGEGRIWRKRAAVGSRRRNRTHGPLAAHLETPVRVLVEDGAIEQRRLRDCLDLLVAVPAGAWAAEPLPDREQLCADGLAPARRRRDE